MAISSARSVVSIQEKTHFDRHDARIEKYTLGDDLPTKITQLHLRPQTKTPGFTIRKLCYDDREAALKFLNRFFFRDEPMNKAVKLLEKPDSKCEELEEYTASSLKDGVSLAAIDDKGEFVGLIINGIIEKKDMEEEKDDPEMCPNEKFRRILKVLTHLNTEGKLWEKVSEDCEKILEIRIASTHTGWRGRGLMRVLCEETERLAVEKGACAVRMDATSKFSAAAAERLKYKCIYSVRYADLPFAPQPEAPHHEARVYLKIL